MCIRDRYSVTLYDKTGKALVNKTVRFNINGIFYERKTNEKGVAQLNISYCFIGGWIV